jgi:hypothetical protein
MEKKELQRMMKHRGLFWSLGLIAALAMSAREANASPMSLTVYVDGGVVYSTSGDDTSVTADTVALNSALNGTAYSFTGLSGASNFPGTSGPVGGFISVAGNISYDPAIGGTDTIKIVFSEGGFTSPSAAPGNQLVSTATANYSGTSPGTASPLGPTYQTYDGAFADSSSPQVTATTPTITLLSTGGAADNHTDASSSPLGQYVTTYTLTGTLNINMNASSASPSNNVFTAKTSVLPALVTPEPASLVMMVTGMPLPLVVMGLLRRRRAAA